MSRSLPHCCGVAGVGVDVATGVRPLGGLDGGRTQRDARVVFRARGSDVDEGVVVEGGALLGVDRGVVEAVRVIGLSSRTEPGVEGSGV